MFPPFRSIISVVKHISFYRLSCRQKSKRCSTKLFNVGRKERERKWMSKAQRTWNNLPRLPCFTKVAQQKFYSNRTTSQYFNQVCAQSNDYLGSLLLVKFKSLYLQQAIFDVHLLLPCQLAPSWHLPAQERFWNYSWIRWYSVLLVTLLDLGS